MQFGIRDLKRESELSAGLSASERPTTPSGTPGSIEFHAPAELLVLVADELDNLIVG